MQKGGVAKSTTAINLGYELVLLGYRVLVIDLDQQANTTAGLAITVDRTDDTMYDVLVDDRELRVPLADVIQKSPHGMDVAPAHAALRRLERTGLGAGGEGRLARQIETVADRYDIIILDCPPSLGEITTAAFTAATSILATVLAGPDEINALTTMENTVRDVQDGFNPNVNIDHVLLTRFVSGNKVGKDIRRALERDWPEEYLGEISATVRIPEAKARQLPVRLHDPGATATADYTIAATTLAERMLAHVVTR